MADGTDPLFNNQRTGQWMDLATAWVATSETIIWTFARTKLTEDTVINVPDDYATVQEAWNHICRDLDLNGFNVTIQMADGTHNGGLDDYPVELDRAGSLYIGGGIVILNGNAASPQSVIFTHTGDTLRLANNYLLIQNFELRSSGGEGMISAWRGVIEIGAGMRFGACDGPHMHASSGGQIRALENYAIVGSASTHAFIHSGGQIRVSSITITLTGTPAFSTAYLDCSAGGLYDAIGTVYSGAATGPQWQLGDGALVILNEEGDLTVLPGDSGGNDDTSFTVDEVTGPFPQLLHSGSFPAGESVLDLELPFWVKEISIHVNGLSSDTATRHPIVLFSDDGGLTFPDSYMCFGLDATPALVLDDAAISMFTDVAAARSWQYNAWCSGIQGGEVNSRFIGLNDDFSAGVSTGNSYSEGLTGKKTHLRFAWNDTGDFDGGTYEVYAHG